jgi:hypothetical protein
MAAIVGYQADLYMASGAGVTFTTEAVGNTGDNQAYRASVTAHRYWDDTSALTVEFSVNGGANWNPAVAGTYTVQYCGGVITFTTVDAARTVRASGKYLAISQIGQASSWEANPSANLLDVTTFGSNGWKTKLVSLKEASAKATRYYIDGAFLALLGGRFVLVLYTNFAAGSRLEGFAYLKTPAVKVSVDSTVDESLDFEIDGKLFYLAS